jgi:hypothetical protein
VPPLYRAGSAPGSALISNNFFYPKLAKVRHYCRDFYVKYVLINIHNSNATNLRKEEEEYTSNNHIYYNGANKPLPFREKNNNRSDGPK